MSGQPITSGPESSPGQQPHSEVGSWRDVLLGVVIVAVVACAYFIARHRRASHLNAFAQCLAAKQTKMYGAYWCPHCAEQKEIFAASFQYVPYVECGIKGSRAESPGCLQAGIKRFPTWQFSDGERREGAMQLRALSEKTGCALP
jgi:phage baseplate assembly protein gpV